MYNQYTKVQSQYPKILNKMFDRLSINNLKKTEYIKNIDYQTSIAFKNHVDAESHYLHFEFLNKNGSPNSETTLRIEKLVLKEKNMKTTMNLIQI